MTRHQHAHEIAGIAKSFVARHHDLIDVFIVEVADRPLDQRALLVDESRRSRLQRKVAYRFPGAQQILEIALDLRLGARRTGGAQDHAHTLRHLQLLGDVLEPPAVQHVGDLAADAAATRGIRHQYRVAAREGQIRRQRRALGAALLLDDLHQHDLPTFDYFLDLVLATVTRRTVRHFFHGVIAADRFNYFLLITLGGLAITLGGLALADGIVVVVLL